MMAASLSGSIKALIEASPLGLACYRDDVGKGTPGTRYVTISEGIVVTTDRLSGEHDDPVTELVQVDLWQPWRAVNPGDPAEDYSLADNLALLLHGALLPSPPSTVRSCTLDDSVRLLERDSNIVHHAYTVRIKRDR